MWLYLFANVNLCRISAKIMNICSCFLIEEIKKIWRENVANVETVKI